MRLLDGAPESAEENLALDESLLHEGREVLRFWESTRTVVVVGRSGRVAEQVREGACAADAVTVLRRCSGGGAVVLASGCLNFSLIFSLTDRPAWRNVGRSLEEILGRMARALDAEMREPSDLASEDRKISGSAQRRTATALLHHGTVLFGFDAELAERYLRHPRREPDYRIGRTHRAFLGNLLLSEEEIRARITTAWTDTPQITDFTIASL